MSPPISRQSSEKGAPRNIVLIGLSGSGKTTVGRLVAGRLGWMLVDTDTEIERTAGLAVSRLFAERGEPHFRALEQIAVASACQSAGCVISTGGGAVLDPVNRRRLWENNVVIYLQASTEVLTNRLARAGADDRPLLAGDRRERLAALMRERDPLYREAHTTIATDDRSPEQVADEVVKVFERDRQ